MIKKYLLFAFLLENIITQTSLLGWLSNYLFYPFMALGALYVVNGSIFQDDKLRKFGWMYALMLVYIIYEFVIGAEYISLQTLLYLVAKITTFSIMIVSIDANEAFYRGKAVWWLALATGFFLIVGMATGGDVVSGRALAGYTNSNTAGSLGAMTVGMLLFYMRGRKWNAIPILIMLFGMYGVLAGASRAGFLVLFLLIFFRYGINAKTVGTIGLVVVLGLFLLPAIGIETVGIQRLIDTYEGTEGTNREVEREAAKWMIAQKPWTGWGFEAVNQGIAAELTTLSSHNGYLEIVKQMGYPASIAFFLIILTAIVNYWNSFRRYRLHMNLFFALVLTLLIKANYEAGFVGVHEYGTNLFFFALAMMSSQVYSLKRGIHYSS